MACSWSTNPITLIHLWGDINKHKTLSKQNILDSLMEKMIGFIIEPNAHVLCSSHNYHKVLRRKFGNNNMQGKLPCSSG